MSVNKDMNINNRQIKHCLFLSLLALALATGLIDMLRCARSLPNQRCRQKGALPSIASLRIGSFVAMILTVKIPHMELGSKSDPITTSLAELHLTGAERYG
ncbi:hypothetical protein NQD34_002811 [Periophthalmus magnuspinnatus]|nr:hypothetical protein NQD34_002811 [Periophthalmus magnuspinnatus]